MFALGYVILPFSATLPADAIRASLARFQRGQRGDLPESWLSFEDETEAFLEDYRAKTALNRKILDHLLHGRGDGHHLRGDGHKDRHRQRSQGGADLVAAHVLQDQENELMHGSSSLAFKIGTDHGRRSLGAGGAAGQHAGFAVDALFHQLAVLDPQQAPGAGGGGGVVRHQQNRFL